MGADPADRKQIAERMRAAEHAGDEATHAIMRELNETFVTPFDREDIYRLASSLDDVMDAMEAAVDLVVLYQIGELPPEIADQVDVLERAAELTADGDAAAARDEGPRPSSGSSSTGWRTRPTRSTGGCSPACSAASTTRSRC